MDSPDTIALVLRRYPLIGVVERVEPLGSGGGLSGARLWRLTAAGRMFCLRRWPSSHPDEARLRFIHEILRTAHERGIGEIPSPLPCNSRETFVRHDGTLWELTPWMPGVADYHADPRPAKLHAALQWLARFHLAAADRPRWAPSPGIHQRRELLQRLVAGEADEIEVELSGLDWRPFVDRARRILAAFRAAGLQQQLEETSRIEAPLQPCIRDIWHDHVLFQGDCVSGVVDFGASRIECVAADLSRLLGSFAGEERAVWQDGLAAYEAVRPLAEAERRLVKAFDESGVVLSGMNWLRWICLERRLFDQPERILPRLDEILSRLDRPRTLIVE